MNCKSSSNRLLGSGRTGRSYSYPGCDRYRRGFGPAAGCCRGDGSGGRRDAHASDGRLSLGRHHWFVGRNRWRNTATGRQSCRRLFDGRHRMDDTRFGEHRQLGMGQMADGDVRGVRDGRSDVGQFAGYHLDGRGLDMDHIDGDQTGESAGTIR